MIKMQKMWNYLIGMFDKILHLFEAATGKNHMIYLGCPSYLLVSIYQQYMLILKQPPGIFMDWFCCDVWKPWPLPAHIGVKPVFLCPFGKSGHRCKTHMGVSGNVNRTNHELMISVPHERQFQGICVCVESCAMLLEDGPQKNVFFVHHWA